jgi:hypothetical protein
VAVSWLGLLAGCGVSGIILGVCWIAGSDERARDARSDAYDARQRAHRRYRDDVTDGDF